MRFDPLSLSNRIYLKNGWSIFILLSPVFCPCLKDDTFFNLMSVVVSLKSSLSSSSLFFQFTFFPLTHTTNLFLRNKVQIKERTAIAAVSIMPYVYPLSGRMCFPSNSRCCFLLKESSTCTYSIWNLLLWAKWIHQEGSPRRVSRIRNRDPRHDQV